MPRLSRLAANARPSPIRSMTLECARLGGINLAQGICDTPVPEPVARAAQDAIEAGANIYSRYDGHVELREALAEKMARHNGLAYDPDGEIVVTSGATGAFYAACLATLDPGDEVIVFEPSYGYHTHTLASLGVRPVTVDLPAPDWRFDAARVAAAITARTRAIVVNTPVNPSGKVFARDELDAIAGLVLRHDLLLFTDEVYEHFIYEGHRHVSPATLPGLRERTLTINALSKTFAITGWRLGWLAAPREVCAAIGPLCDLVYVCAPSPLQLGAAAGLRALPESYYSEIGREYEHKRDLLCAALRDAGLPPHVPAGSYFTLADISRLPGATSDERAMHLLREVGIACVPGSAFWEGEGGEEAPDGRGIGRFCFGKTDADLAEACARLRKLA